MSSSSSKRGGAAAMAMSPNTAADGCRGKRQKQDHHQQEETTVKVIMLSGSETYIAVCSSTTCASMKEKISAESGIPADAVVIHVADHEHPLQILETYASAGSPDELYVCRCE